MLKFNDVKVGDYLFADNDGDKTQGEVTNLNNNEKQVCIYNGVQGFWYEMSQISAIDLNDEQLENLKFTKQLNDDGTIKYSKGAFRILINNKNNFENFEIWYRDEKRQILQPIFVHQLQNHFYEMTKVHLTTEEF